MFSARVFRNHFNINRHRTVKSIYEIEKWVENLKETANQKRVY